MKRSSDNIPCSDWRERAAHTLQMLMLMALLANSPAITLPPWTPDAFVVLVEAEPRAGLRWHRAAGHAETGG